MTEDHATQGGTCNSNIGQMLAEKRTCANLSLPELAAMSRLPLDFLEGIELRGQPVPSFEICAKIAQALNSRHTQGLMLARELWQAVLADKAATLSRAAATGSLRSAVPPRVEPS